MKKGSIDFDPAIPTLEIHKSSRIGIIIAHGERTNFDEGIIASLAKKLAEKNITSVRFPFPFKIKGERYNKDTQPLDESFVAVFRSLSSQYPDTEWLLCGHDIGAESAVRIAPMASEDGELPHIICLNYPLYPPNRPERVNMSPLAAIIGEALVCQGTESNRGEYKRMRNSLQMMAAHVQIRPIKGANHLLEVEGKTSDRVAFWISNDIERFIADLGLTV